MKIWSALFDLFRGHLNSILRHCDLGLHWTNIYNRKKSRSYENCDLESGRMQFFFNFRPSAWSWRTCPQIQSKARSPHQEPTQLVCWRQDKLFRTKGADSRHKGSDKIFKAISSYNISIYTAHFVKIEWNLEWFTWKRYTMFPFTASVTITLKMVTPNTIPSKITI